MLFLECSQSFSGQGVPDPYYGKEDGFSFVLDMIEEGADTFLNKMYPQQSSI
jgi:protein-tyrosine-phosphatase